MELWLTVNGKRTCASAQLDPLTRSVVISLFTWRRAEPDDNADVPMGWWGDTWPAVQNDRYGSRLWLLQRSKLTNQLVQTVRGYIGTVAARSCMVGQRSGDCRCGTFINPRSSACGCPDAGAGSAHHH